MYMSRRTLVLLPVAALGFAQAWLLPPSMTMVVARGRMIAAFLGVGLFCASWLLDGDRPERDD